ncbi:MULTISPECIES: helix-turn-helix transcriptional regulator [Staphylococcus]|uniref:helix-turn-helix transcriptional regulator n=1 Tax=Staphylococcus TaxID=1279 RepID=UPI001CB99502|nr:MULTISPECIES: helix-turn-helix transcriptional regulator [Staphylococcus]MCI2747084.1 helix-turn-helix transcriptional regulator [Staphylococcus warneri]MCI2767677.1 helix-turn-helix transcriptional regulator [Staphylococcus warneri]MCI2777425.1 helix-turn-helix transcriptional regulator [Staphylococcus warneri]MCI2787094.1 helix-turn-helix transcriptional regulator [Staphylococcus warneri]
MSDYKLKIIELIESDITGYQVFKDTGLSQTVMSSLRTGKRDVDNLRLGTTEKLYEYACKVL